MISFKKSLLLRMLFVPNQGNNVIFLSKDFISYIQQVFKFIVINRDKNNSFFL